MNFLKIFLISMALSACGHPNDPCVDAEDFTDSCVEWKEANE